MRLFQQALAAMLLLCIGCTAQSVSPELNKRIERRVRITYQLPADVDVHVLERKPSTDFPNYDTLTVQLSQGARKLTQEFLISKDNSTLVRATKMDLSKDPYADIMSKIDVNGRPVLGNKNAKVTIVNFDDFECPFCARMNDVLLKDIAKNYGDRVRIIYKDFPLVEIHPWAIHAAVDANCLAAQNGDAYWDFAGTVHSSQKEITGTSRPLPEQLAAVDKITTEIGQKHDLQMTPLLSCIKAQNTDAVQASMKEGNALGVSATPSMFINGEKVDGAVPASQVKAVIDRALRDAGEPVTTAAAEKK